MQKDKIQTILFVLGVLALVIRGFVYRQNRQTILIPSVAEVCTEFEGNRLEEYKECEFISQDRCDTQNGVFSECESACRHDENAEICTLQCVPVCLIPTD